MRRVEKARTQEREKRSTKEASPAKLMNLLDGQKRIGRSDATLVLGQLREDILLPRLIRVQKDERRLGSLGKGLDAEN